MGTAIFFALFVAIIITVTFPVIKGDDENAKCSPAQLRPVLDKCGEKYNATYFNGLLIDHPWSAVRQADILCKTLNKEDYLGYVDCRLQAFLPCTGNSGHESSNHSAWYDVVCHSSHNTTCLRQLYGSGTGVTKKCWEQDYTKEINAAMEERPWVLKSCQLEHEVNKCLVKETEKCSSDTAAMFRENLKYALHETCADKTLFQTPVVG